MIRKSNDIQKDHPLTKGAVPFSTFDAITFLDIETTGLSRKKDPVILIGSLTLDSSGGTLTQFFAPNPDDERGILLALIECLSLENPIITFNGHAFDIPFLNHRMAVHNLPYQIPLSCGIDLLPWSRKAFPSAPRHTLKTIESLLGIHRSDTLSGADCVKKYFAYLDSHDPTLAAEICHHNYEDILHMVPLLKLFDMLPGELFLNRFPFSFSLKDHRFWFSTPEYKNGFLTLFGETADPYFPSIFNYPGSATLESRSGTLLVKVPAVEFDYPHPGSLFVDTDRIPGYGGPFNQLSFEDKMNLLIREGACYSPLNLSRVVNRLALENETP